MYRYSRQMLVKDIGEEGQRKLSQSRVLLVGCGALGTAIANILVRAGVGFLRIVDGDIVEESNLQRQNLFDEEHVKQGLPKAVAALGVLRRVNSDVELDAVVGEFDPKNGEKYARDVNLILDGTDNFQTRFLINNIAVKHGIPWIHGGVVSTSGIVMNILPGEGPCLECLYPYPPAGGLLTCHTAGVLGTITSVIGSLQANEAIKYLTGNEEKMVKGLLYIDLWDGTFERVEVARKEGCKCCGERDFRWMRPDQEDAVYMCGRNSVQVKGHGPLDLASVEERLASAGIEVYRNKFLLKFGVEGLEITLFPDGRAIVKNTDQPALAKRAYIKYIGL